MNLPQKQLFIASKNHCEFNSQTIQAHSNIAKHKIREEYTRGISPQPFLYLLADFNTTYIYIYNQDSRMKNQKIVNLTIVWVIRFHVTRKLINT